MFESKPAPYRILHRTPDALVYYEIAQAFTREDILADWYWLVANVFQVLREMENYEEVTNFTLCKILSLVAQRKQAEGASSAAALTSSAAVTEPDSAEAKRVQQSFGLAKDDQVVQYFSCGYAKGLVPRQGTMYLSLNHLCFSAGALLGKETKLVLRYSDIVDIVRSGNSITVVTQLDKHYRFNTLFNTDAMHGLLQQLSKITMQNLLQDPEQPTIVPDSAKLLGGSPHSSASPSPSMASASASSSSASTLLRSLNARQCSESYRAFFRLPQSELLDGKIKGGLVESVILLNACVHDIPCYFSPPRSSLSVIVVALHQTLCERNIIRVTAFPLLQKRPQGPSQPMHSVLLHSGAFVFCFSLCFVFVCTSDPNPRPT